MRQVWCLVFGILSLGPWLAAAASEPPSVAPENMSGEDIMNTLIARGKDKRKGGGKIDVDAAHAALCPVCHQPLYKHQDPGFECLPDLTDPVTGRPRQISMIQYAPVTCPVCQARFQGPLPGNINDKNGLDRDFCRHSVGKAAVHATVWMCPDCGYTGPASATGFSQELDGKPLTEETVRLVKARLSGPTRKWMIELAGLVEREGRPIPPSQLQFSTYIEQTAIPDWMKYENALTLLEGQPLKPPHVYLGRLYLSAAHACRREVCAQVGIPLLDPVLQDPLGRSIRRVSGWLTKECLEIRQAQHQELTDPTQAETDAAVLLEAAARLEARVAQVLRTESQNPPAEGHSAVNVLDQYVLHLRHAGFLDRLGRIADAEEELAKAREVIPPVPGETAQPQTPEAKKYAESQLGLVRGVPSTRIECLKKEREYLFRAADHLMQAFFFNESPDKLDPATNSFLTGELLRRDGREPEAAAAWFQAARQLLAKLEPEKINPELPPNTPPEEADRMREKARRSAAAQREVLTTWADEQLKLVQEKAAGRTPRENVRQAIARVLERAHVAVAPLPEPGAGAAAGKSAPPVTANDAAAGKAAPPVTPRDVAPTTEKDAPPTTAKDAAPAPAPKAGLTREAVLTRYYEALQKYNQEKNANPANLADLVKGGYLDAAVACLDANGQLICPVSGKRLIYLSSTKLGDAALPLIFPGSADPSKVRLFGDGRVAEK